MCIQSVLLQPYAEPSRWRRASSFLPLLSNQIEIIDRAAWLGVVQLRRTREDRAQMQSSHLSASRTVEADFIFPSFSSLNHVLRTEEEKYTSLFTVCSPRDPRKNIDFVRGKPVSWRLTLTRKKSTLKIMSSRSETSQEKEIKLIENIDPEY